jgi:small subunit ribosomal protein S3
MSAATITTTKKVMNKFARNTDIDEFLEIQLKDAGYGGVDISTSPVGTKITLYVQRPGLVIGRRGVGIRDLTEKMEKKFALPNPQISVVEESVPELNPRIMANRIAQTVVRGTAFRRAAIWTLNSMMNAGAMGAEIIIAGKLRSERAHFERYHAGIVPKSGDSAERIVRRATTDVLLKMGLYGIQVKIALKDRLPPEIELKETNEPKPAQEGQAAVVDQSNVIEAKTSTESSESNQEQAPRSSKQVTSSKKEEIQANEAA